MPAIFRTITVPRPYETDANDTRKSAPPCAKTAGSKFIDAVPRNATITPAHRNGETFSFSSSAANTTEAGAHNCIATTIGAMSVANLRPVY